MQARIAVLVPTLSATSWSLELFPHSLLTKANEMFIARFRAIGLQP